MQATLTFDAENDRDAFLRASRADDAFRIIWEIYHEIRNLKKERISTEEFAAFVEDIIVDSDLMILYV